MRGGERLDEDLGAAVRARRPVDAGEGLEQGTPVMGEARPPAQRNVDSGRGRDIRIAVLTFDGFNEIDSFVASHILNRAKRPGWKAEIASPTEWVRSMNGVRVMAERQMEFANEADAVLVGSGRLTRQIVEDEQLLSRLELDPSRQLIGSQCSGALLLAKLGLLASRPACTDMMTKPFLEATGVQVLDRPFFAQGNVATAGGCLSASYLATWVLWRLLGRNAAEEALSYVAPVGERHDFIARALGAVEPFVEPTPANLAK
jgi:transcriptional regulator GlxA family with amidase domain